MKLSQIIIEGKRPVLERNNSYLYEGLSLTEAKSMNLWENAGRQLYEANLTKDQILQLFADVEQGATAGGANRTALGKGKDAATAVNKAWEDLKTKIQDSGPVKAVDQKYDDAIAKIEAGLGGPDNKVNQVIQRYRKFAKEHPVAQGFVYAALIAAAGISGAGLGGAAVLGLLKMSDKLLQGEKFSSAAYAGAKTGVLAFAASQVGDYIKDKFATYTTENTYYVNGQEVDKATYEATMKGIQSDLAKKGIDFEKGTFDKTAVDAVVKDQLGSAASSASSAASTGSDLSNQILDQSLSHPAGRSAARQAVAAALDSGDITAAQGKELIKQIGSAAANPEAAERAITQTLQNVGGSAAKSAATSAGTSIADVASSAASSAADLPVGGGIKAPDFDPGTSAASSSSDLFTINGKTMSKALQATVEKMSDEDAEKAISAWRVLVGGSADTQAQMGAGQLIDQLTKKYQESVTRSGKKLSEGQVYLLFKRTEVAQVYLAEAGLLSKVGGAIKGAASKLGQKITTKGKNLTTKVTADKLNSAWQKAGSPTDSNELHNFLQQQGVSKEVINPVFDTMKLPVPKSAAQDEPADDKQAAAGQKLNPAAAKPAQDAKSGTVGLQTQPGETPQAQSGNTADGKPVDKTGKTDYQLGKQSNGNFIYPGQKFDTASGEKLAPAATQSQDGTAPKQSQQIDIVTLATEIKSSDPDITGDVKRLLDDYLKADKKAAPKEQPKQDPAAPAAA